MSNSRALLLDVTRTLLRTGRPTGIDRVEIAYARRFLNAQHPAQFLARIGTGELALSKDAYQTLLAEIDGQRERGKVDWRARAQFWRPRARAWLDARLRALGETPDPGAVYINVGHSHDAAIARRAQPVVMIHDTIPLDHPEYQTPQSVDRFRRFLRASRHARLIANSQATRDRVQHWFDHWEERVEITVAPLGIDPPADIAPYKAEHPYIVMLGTIEPRKNVGFALDLAAVLATAGIDLHLIGRRGWMIEDIAARLDGKPDGVREYGNLNDTEVTAHLRGAVAMIYPSFAEGFGLPLLEALQLGVPVIASDLPVFRELAGEHALYLTTDTVNTWASCIIDEAQKFARNQPNRAISPELSIPRWENHFAIVEPLLR